MRRTAFLATTALILTGALTATATIVSSRTTATRVRRLVTTQIRGGDGSVLSVIADTVHALALTPEQKDALRAVLAAHANNLAAVGARELEARLALLDTIHRPEPDPVAVRTASVAVAAADMDLSLERGAMVADGWSILDDQQRAALGTGSEQIRAAVAARLHDVLAGTDEGALASRLADRLALTDDQRNAIRGVLSDHAAALASLAATESATRAHLRAAIRRPVLDAGAIRHAQTAVSAADLDLALERASLFSDVWAILTPSQQQQLSELRSAALARIQTRVQEVLSLLRELA